MSYSLVIEIFKRLLKQIKRSSKEYHLPVVMVHWSWARCTTYFLFQSLSSTLRFPKPQWFSSLILPYPRPCLSLCLFVFIAVSVSATTPLSWSLWVWMDSCTSMWATLFFSFYQFHIRGRKMQQVSTLPTVCRKPDFSNCFQSTMQQSASIILALLRGFDY